MRVLVWMQVLAPIAARKADIERRLRHLRFNTVRASCVIRQPCHARRYLVTKVVGSLLSSFF